MAESKDNLGRTLRGEKSAGERSRIVSHVSASLFALFFVVLTFQFRLDSLQGLLADGLFRIRWTHTPNPKIRLIAYDDQSSVRYDPGSKIPAQELALILEFLARAKTEAIALIASINEKLYTDEELALIAGALSKHANAFIGYIDDESLGKSPPLRLAGFSRYLPGFISRDAISYGADSVSRRVMITLDGLPSLYAELARLSNHSNSGTTFRNVEPLGDFQNSTQTYINWQGPAGSYPLIASADVVQERISPSDFNGKIVLIGRALRAKGLEDFILTPFSREPLRTPLLEGAAHSLATLVDNTGLSRSPPWASVMLSLCLALATINLVLVLSPMRGILFVGAELIGLLVLGWFSLNALNCWLDFAHPLILVCVGYYLVIPYRFVDESRKRWYYQEKSELMAQLEQLKSNFLSLMSHDLKTPIARIQGAAELLLNESAALSDKQRQTLSTIVDTSESLSQHVQTVLDLARIESAQVPIQKSSKDINVTIAEVVESKRPLAAEKEIELVTNLEPLFSFKFDVNLIRRVIANLVENAIKYSPERTTITLASREEKDWVHVSVSDQGMGIPPEEQEKVFVKFYRGQGCEKERVKGTGLGLYLVRYFVELHEGVVKLSSEVGKGSTFTVSLPLQSAT